MPIERFFGRIFHPVRRQGADRYLRLTLLAFALSVVLTRLFLSLTGYPQIGGGTLHIAHLLWGGLLLFGASLLPLVFANRWVYTTGAVLGGLGTGLFIDEVGKFITRNYDYFYPAAAPIIYAFFLLVVLLYTRLRRPAARDPRSELYRIFDDMSEVLDRDLDPHERADLEARLRWVAAQQAEPDYARLAQVLLDFVGSDTAFLRQPVPGRFAHWLARGRQIEARLFTRPRFKSLLVAGLAVVGLFSLGQLAVLALAAAVPSALPAEARLAAGLPPSSAAAAGQPDDTPLGPKDETGAASATGPVTTAPDAQPPADARPVPPQVRTFRGHTAFWLRAGLEALVGLLLVAAAFCLLARRERLGIVLGAYALLLALTTLNLLVFYFDQFAAVVEAVLQFGLYQALVRYRQRYLASARL